jgi:hypothetical protein
MDKANREGAVAKGDRMNWSDHKKRIRRYLRDPDKNIWPDAMLMHLWNDAQHEFQNKAGVIEDIATVRVPPQFGVSYTHDWEWEYANQFDGKTYQCFRYDHNSERYCAFRWETMIGTASSDEGDFFIHPWEAGHCSTPGAFIPLWFPVNFHKMKFIAWDEDPIDYVDKKAIQTNDMSYMTRQGVPFSYWRPDETENTFHLYPQPDSPVFDDVTGQGQVLFDDQDDTYSGELGLLADYPEMFQDQETGIVTDVVETENNVFMIFEANATEMSVDDDQWQSDWPRFLTKYIEYGTIERAYGANTDGRLPSLEEYWSKRKEIGLEVMRRFKSRIRTDRDYRMITKGAPGERTRHRHPRLPDAYPAVNP